MTVSRWVVLVLALLGVALSLWRLEGARAGLERTELAVGSTPATVWRLPGAGPAPVVVIAHGFAGSRPLMEGFAEGLARAGYIAVAYDLAGHGRNPVPMSGDVTSIDGTTRVLMDEMGRVADAALALPGADGRLALVGHSMASDLVVRQALRDPRVGAVVAVSLFTRAATADRPGNLLVVTGAWEGGLTGEALRVVRLTDPGARFSETVGVPGNARRAVLAPGVEHVGVLYSRTTLAETRDWLNAAFGRGEAPEVPLRGPWVLLLMVSLVAAVWPLVGVLRRWRAGVPPPRLAGWLFWVALVVPAVVTPLVLVPLRISFLPVLVADYLAVHFAVMGALTLALAAVFGGVRLGGWRVVPLALPVAVFGILVFGQALDAYVASFWPVGPRVPVVLAMAAGAVPFLTADAVLTEGGRAGWGRVIAVRAVALGSLGLAVALDFERLLFLVIILPVLLLFYVLFGMLGGWVGRATWRPGVQGLGLGIFLGWALGVTFPMFAA